MTLKPFVLGLVALIVIVVGVFYFIPQSVPVPDEAANPAVVDNSGKELQNASLDGWVLSAPSAQGVQFMYPEKLPTKYIMTANWPPRLEMANEDFTCVLSGEFDKKVEKQTIGGKIYCVAISSEGTAGSSYATYQYSTKEGDFLTKLTFSLRFPQCMNYPESEQLGCKAEQSGFDADALADRMFSSVRMH